MLWINSRTKRRDCLGGLVSSVDCITLHFVRIGGAAMTPLAWVLVGIVIVLLFVLLCCMRMSGHISEHERQAGREDLEG